MTVAASVRLLPMREPTASDEAGFRRPFAALVLSEVARTDRVAPWLDAAQRETVVAPAPLPDWHAALQSRTGLARRHNVRAFLTAIYSRAHTTRGYSSSAEFDTKTSTPRAPVPDFA